MIGEELVTITVYRIGSRYFYDKPSASFFDDLFLLFLSETDRKLFSFLEWVTLLDYDDIITGFRKNIDIRNTILTLHEVPVASG